MDFFMKLYKKFVELRIKSVDTKHVILIILLI